MSDAKRLLAITLAGTIITFILATAVAAGGAASWYAAIPDWGNSDHLLPLAVDTLVFTFRMLAAVFSTIAFASWWGQRRSEERPPYDRRANDIAWNWAFVGMILGGFSFVALDFAYRNVTGKAVSDLFVALVWWCWANAATVRLASKAVRPRMVYLSATIFVVGGSAYAFLAAI